MTSSEQNLSPFLPQSLCSWYVCLSCNMHSSITDSWILIGVVRQSWKVGVYDLILIWSQVYLINFLSFGGEFDQWMHILTSEDHLMLLYILIYVQEPSKINLRPLCREVQFFFSWPGVGLTNRPPVRDSDPGPPLLSTVTCLCWSHSENCYLVWLRKTKAQPTLLER